MAFTDILLFEMVCLVMATVLIGYVGIVGYFAMRANNAKGLKETFRGAAVPLGSLGFTATTLGIWGEMVWPLPGSYNILFTDVFLLFGVTLLVLAVSMALSLKLQYAGLFGLVSGGMAIAYGYNGWQLGMTKEPFDTFLLFAGFGFAGILGFPATVVADRYLAHPDGSAFSFGSSLSVTRRHPSIQAATQAAQPIVPGGNESGSETESAGASRFHLPVYISATMIIFVVFIALAGIAALYFVDSTLPAHLASAP
jgi:putative membrane protein